MFDRQVHRLTSAPALRLLAIVGLAGWTLGFAVHLAANRSLIDHRGEPVGGDFISPYAAGRLVLEGVGHRLYDLRLQQQMQGRIVGRPDFRGLCSFVNPPAVAVAFAPLAMLPFRVAYVVYTALLLAAYLLGVRLLRPHLPAFHQTWTTTAVLGLLFYPFVVTITGGQNTAITWLLLAGTYAELRNGRDIRAGVWLGLLFYKPQFALLPLLLVALQRRLRALSAAGVVAAILYLLGAAICGFDWPALMLRSLRTYWPLENHFNGHTSISLIGVCDAALPGGAGRVIGTILSLSVVASCVILWRRSVARPDLCWALAVSGSILISPHTQWYDVGLLLLSVFLVVHAQLATGRGIPTGWRLGLVAGFFVPPMFAAAQSIGFQPVFVLALVGFGWTCWAAAGCVSARLPAGRSPAAARGSP